MPKEKKIDKNKLKELYQNKIKIKEIAKFFNCDPKTVFRYLHRYSIKIRGKTKKITWTESEIDFLKKHYPIRKKEEIREWEIYKELKQLNIK
jgi:intein-encoded DNA endonuclease-like protein